MYYLTTNSINHASGKEQKLDNKKEEEKAYKMG
jgi:hypothetical protein